MFNLAYHRNGTGDELSYGTIAGDIEQEGRALLECKRQTAQSLLISHGFAASGLYPAPELPEKYRNGICEMLTISGDELLRKIVPGWDGENTELDQPGLIPEPDDPDAGSAECPETVSYSEADTEVFRTRRCRRGKRSEISAEDKQQVCDSFASWYNRKSSKEIYGIIHTWQIEKNSGDAIYISIDAVFVDQQAETRSKAGMPNNPERQMADGAVRKISHMNIRLDADDSAYFITSTDTEEAFRELVAVILNNELYRRFMVFFIDGELSLAEHIKTYFSRWEHKVYLDWMHLEHKCYERLSMAITGKRVADPRGNVEYYSKGPKKGQVKNQDFIALSRLYARAMIRILWTGNVDEAISYIANLDPKIVKNKGEAERLSKYLENKREWITCYALRKKAGLKNSSNGVECQNNVLVAERQKNGRASWRPEGSGYLSSITALFSNGEDREWFYGGKISFKMAV